MDEYIGIVKIFGGNFAPQGWFFCDGSLQSIADYPQLYALLGTCYGGDGVNTFGLPDLRGRIPVGVTNTTVPGLPTVALGQQAGEEQHTLIVTEMPSHNHIGMAANSNSTDQTPTSGNFAMGIPGNTSSGSFSPSMGYNSADPDTTLHYSSVSMSGGNEPHENRQPYLAVNYVICYEGIFPSHS